MVTWLFLPSPADREESVLTKDMDVLISDLKMRIHPIDPFICEIYISVLQALKLMQSQWYPVIRIDYAVYRQIGYLQTQLGRATNFQQKMTANTQLRLWLLLVFPYFKRALNQQMLLVLVHTLAFPGSPSPIAI